MIDDWLDSEGDASPPTSDAPARDDSRSAAEARVREAAGYHQPAPRDPSSPRGDKESLDAIRGITLPPVPTRAQDDEARDDWQRGTPRPSRDASRPRPRPRGRAAASAKAAQGRRRTLLIAGAATAALIVVVGAAVLLTSRTPVTARLADGEGSLRIKSSAASPSKPIVATPVFAHIGNLKIHLPIDPKAATGVAFHQASYGHSYDMVPNVTVANRAAVFAEVKGGKKFPLASPKTSVTGVVLRDGERIMDSVWRGSLVELWRNGRPGKPDTAADCGAPYGTQIVAPVSGTVTRIRPYKLYGRYPDFEIHIEPDGMRQADLVCIHVTGVIVRPGEHLVGGVSPIAHVRRFDDKFAIQLAEYTGDPGNHVHIQFNEPKGSSGTGGD